MRMLIAAMAVVLSGCGTQTNPDHEAILELQRRVDAIQAEQKQNFELLSEANANIHKRINATQLDFQESQKTSSAQASADGSAWIAWESRTISENPNRVMYKNLDPIPKASYSSQSVCYAAADRVSKASGGSRGVWSETNSSQVTFLHSVSCLPKGVDPR